MSRSTNDFGCRQLSITMVIRVQRLGADFGSDSIPGYLATDFFLKVSSSSLPTLDVRRRKLLSELGAGLGSLDLNRLRKNRLIFPVSGREDLAADPSLISCCCLLPSSLISLPVDICTCHRRDRI